MNKNFIITMTALLAAGLCLAVPGCPPTIDAVDPGAAQVGDLVQITGADFGDVQGESTVSFAGTAAGVADSWSASEIIVAVPEGAVSGAVVVVVGEVASNEHPFMILDECDGFNGGDFNFSPVSASDECFSWPFSDLLELALVTVDLEVFNPVEVPSSLDLPKGFEFEFPGFGSFSFAIDLGVEHCWEGSLSVGEPISFDLGEITGGVVDCTMTVTQVNFTLDPASDDEIVFELSMEIASMEGETCPPNNAPGCTMSIMISGSQATPEG